MPPLSGSFRLTGKEYAACSYLRANRKMSVNHIAKLLGRSTASVHRVLELAGIGGENRGKPASVHAARITAFTKQMRMLRMSLRAYFLGLVTTLREAFDEVALGNLLTENSDCSTGDEPP